MTPEEYKDKLMNMAYHVVAGAIAAGPAVAEELSNLLTGFAMVHKARLEDEDER